MSTRILVVDDELDTLSLLRTILEISGFDPITTLNSVDAIGLAEMEKPDVVLLDIMMPKLDGFTLCKMMRENPATSNLPIIFVTAYESLDIEERRVEAGADKVIHKPISVDMLITSINEVMALRVVPPVESSGDDHLPKSELAAKAKTQPLVSKNEPSPAAGVPAQKPSEEKKTSETPNSKA